MSRPALIVPEDEFRKLVDELSPRSKNLGDLCNKIAQSKWAHERKSTSGALLPMTSQTAYLHIKRLGLTPNTTAEKSKVVSKPVSVFQPGELTVSHPVDASPVLPEDEDIPSPINVDDIFPALEFKKVLKAHPKSGYGMKKVYTPRGECPIVPDGWKRGEAEERDIREWARKVYMYDRSDQGYFTKEAVLYWLRDFYNIHSDEYRQWASIVDSELGDVE